MSMSRLSAILFVLIAALILGGCQQSRSKGLFNRFFEPKPLRVGMTLDAPPLTFRKDDVAAGLEMRFASGLAGFIERPLEIVEVPRDGMAKALLDKKVDILMTGMTVADAHNQKLATSNPYFLSGQVALVHLDDFPLYGTGTRHLTAKNARLGVVGDSSGDTLLKGLGPKGKITRYPSASEAVKALLADTIDVFLFDLPTNAYFAAQYIDKGLTPGTVLLTREPLAWAVRPDDDTLRAAANDYLASLEENGELQKMLEQTIPFYRNTAYSPKQ
jgi:polar amino acid transport system substrate-binding protein